MKRRYFVLPASGEPGGTSGWPWWTIHDRNVDLTRHGNNITDHIYAGMPDAAKVAGELARKYNSGEEKPKKWGNEIGWPEPKPEPGS